MRDHFETRAAMLLTPAQRAEALAALPRWRLDEGANAIRARFLFSDFGEAWAFMTRVALLAEARDHHPDWSNVWNRVDIALTTHDAGGVTRRDVEFAAIVDGWAR